MNKKRLISILTVAGLLFVLSGCSTSQEPISLETTFQNMLESGGFFGAILIWPLAQTINHLASSINVFWAIVIVTVTINVILLALTFKSNMAMQRMQLLQPEIQKIQNKYEGRTDQNSQMRMSQEMQQLYNKYDVNPIGTLLVTFIQFPILIAMYSAINRSTEVKNGTFLGAVLANTPGQAFATLFGKAGDAAVNKPLVLVIVYILMVALQLISISVPQWLTKAKLKREADIHHKRYDPPKQQNFFLTYGMLVFIGFIMLSWPAALSLYYAIYSGVNVIKTLALDKIAQKQDVNK